jgi:hypothetical protein
VTNCVGLVSNWGAVDQLWRHGLVDGLRVDVREHPLLLTEPTHNTPAIRERMLQVRSRQPLSTPCMPRRRLIFALNTCNRRSMQMIFESQMVRLTLCSGSRATPSLRRAHRFRHAL